ncbi:response regulator transcription factor [Algibacter amylolyticus]|uniref:Response regulator transcription factor n=1 Tax=Algibacter amylolyticus TaxID=1608400 RepID=A0A5M7AYV5_9FLAO|nr:response regulator transcription factor [Algibacter amylolyticus]KAA5821840.1 response regulator transcription factor [Algibacter amylolyticus]MBB5269363.1 DNA-binding NarL/FixJ family response regulator [Algibacter amylolyticus]TSJ73124.1 response regulator transcription factor [Algibacter amylolyticus]
MFKKVLVSEDMDDINKGIYNTLKELGVQQIVQVQYCDDAYLKIKKAILDNEPYELLITDLSFKSDHRAQRFTSGDMLLKSIKQEYPDLKAIVYSVEDRLQRVRTLIQDYKVNAYVCKSRRGLVELTKAIQAILIHKTYLSPEVNNALKPKNNLEIEDFDIKLLKQLSLGLSQEEISNYFKERHISPSSLSSIEKRLNKLRIQFKANNAIHLVSIVKDLGLI